MGKKQTQEVADKISTIILSNISKKVNSFETAKEECDRDGMLENQLTNEEWSFVHAQRSRSKDTEETEHAASLLNDMDNKELQEFLEKMRSASN